MKPKDLPSFYKWDDRRPLLHDRILMVPRYYEYHGDWKMPEFSSDQIFGNINPIQIEFCSGNGEWITNLAQENPDINYIAVEWQFKRVRKIWSKSKNYSLNNLLIVCGKAEDFCEYYLPRKSIDKIFINFPDPWPKLKHSKNRLIKAPFTDTLSEIVKEGSTAMFVTDDINYSEQMLAEMKKCSSWEPAFVFPYYRTDVENYGGSYFKRLWKSMGKKIRYIEFRKA